MGITPVRKGAYGGLPPWIKNCGLLLSNKTDNSPNGKWVCSYYCNIERTHKSLAKPRINDFHSAFFLLQDKK